MGFTQLLVNGLIAGSMYAVIAIGFSLIFSLLKFLHFAHGAVVMVGAFTAYTLFSIFSLPWYAAFGGALLFCGVVGIIIEWLVYRPIRNRQGKSLALLLASIGIFSLLEAIVLLFFGAQVRSYGLPLAKSYSALGASITVSQLMLFGVAIILLIVTWLFLKYSKFGVGLRAMADNPLIAASVGVNVNRAMLFTMFIGSLLAGAAGALIGLLQNIDPLMGFQAILKGFTASIIGGVGSVPGSIVGGFIVGIVENLGIWVLPSQWKDAIAFVLLVLFLIFMPQGLFGRKTRA